MPPWHNVGVRGSTFPERHPQEWRAAIDHPFLAGIRDGSLPEGVFAVWLQQDHLFVGDLLSFQARLLAKSHRPAQRVLATGLVALEAELTWFEDSAGRVGVKLEPARGRATQAYRVEFERLLEEPVGVAMTALWALELAYLEAWRGAAPGAAQYRPYVEHWTVPEFAGYVADLGRHAADSAAAEAAWLRIVRLERDFWDMALAGGD